MDDCVSVAGTVFAGSQISVDVIWPAGAAIDVCMSAYFEMGWLGWLGPAQSWALLGASGGEQLGRPCNVWQARGNPKMARCQISLCPRFKLPCSFAVYPYTLHSMNEINVENMFPKLGENIYYWGFPKIRVLAIAHAWAMTKILDEKHQHPYPKFY